MDNQTVIKFVPKVAETADLSAEMVERLQEVLDRVFLSSENAVLPYEQMLTAFIDSFFKYIQLDDNAFLDTLALLPTTADVEGEPDFLNLELEALVNIPIDEGTANAVTLSYTGKGSAVLDAAVTVATLTDTYFNVAQAMVTSVGLPPQAVQTVTVSSVTAPPKPSPNPTDTTPITPDIVVTGIDSKTLDFAPPFFTATGNVFNQGASFNTPGGVVISAYFAEPISAGSSESRVSGEVTLTTPQGNTLVFYTANIDGHSVGDYVFTVSDPTLISSFPAAYITEINGSRYFMYRFVYAITNAENQTNVGELFFMVKDDTPVAGNFAPVAMAEADIQNIGSNDKLVPDVLTGSVLTSPTASNPSYIDANGGTISDVTLAGGTTVVGATTITVTDAVGNKLVLDRATGTYTYTLVHPFTNVDNQPTTLVFTYQITDNNHNQATGTFSIVIADDHPIAVNEIGSANETAFFVSGQVFTGNLLTGDTFGADGGVISLVNGKASVGGIITVDTTYGTIEVWTVAQGGHNIGDYIYTINPAKTIPVPDNLGSVVDTITIQLVDSDGSIANAILNVAVELNQPPVSHNDAYTTDQNTVLTVAASGGVLANDVLPSAGDIDKVISVNGLAVNVGEQIVLPSGALLTVNADGSLSYNPNGHWNFLAQGQTGTETISYTMADAEGLMSKSTVTFTITGLNDAPVAHSDTGVVAENATLSVPVGEGSGLGSGLLFKATDVDNGSVLTISEVNGVAANVGTQITLASGALLTVNANGSYDYNPNGHFDSLGVGQTATDSFTFQVSDGQGGFSTATDTITITGVNNAPTANPDTGTTDKNSSLSVPAATGLLVNAHDVDTGDVLTISAVNGLAANVGTVITLASGALLMVNANGSYDYNPNGQFATLGVGQTATDSFTYQVSDGHGGFVTTTDTITITGVDTPPVANPDTAVTAENMILSVPAGAGTGLGSGLLFNDHDIDNGTVLTVSEVNGVAASVGTQITLASGALLTVNANGSYDYNPNGQFASLGVGQSATDSFTYQVSDGHGGFATSTATITINGVNAAPIANPDTATVAENVTLSVPAGTGLLANDHDVNNGDVLTVSAVNGIAASVGTQITLASGALLTVNADGSYAYDQNGAFDSLGAGKTATDSFTYQVSDGHGGFATTTDTITITGVDTPPVANPDTAVSAANVILSVPAGAGSGLGSGLLFNDHDIDSGTVLTVSEVNGVAASVGTQITLASGALLTVNANGSYDYNPNGHFDSLGVGQTATDSFTYQVSDGHGGFATATDTITITGVNTPPIANPDTAAVVENVALSVPATTGLLANDTDVNNGDALTVSAVNGLAADVGTQITLASGALLTVNADGSYAYNQNGAFDSLGAGKTATDSFTYQVSDGHGGFATATDTITITGVDTPPVANPDMAVSTANAILSVPAGAGSGLGSGLLFNDHDIDNGAVLTVSEVNGVASSVGTQITLASGALLTVNANGSYDYNPNGEFASLGVGQTAADSFTYQVSDGQGGFSTATATITITGVNTPPVANADTATIAENMTLSVAAPAGLLANDTDVNNGDVLTVSAVNGLAADVGTQITLASGALLTVNANGSYDYNPNGEFATLGVGQTAADSFTYQVSDGHGGFSTATDTITITGVNTPPVANADTGLTAQNASLSVSAAMGLLANDHDVNNGDVLTVSAINGVVADVGTQITLASGALLTVNANGSYDYNPNGEFASLGVGQTAADSFTYQVSDGQGGFATATATLTIIGVNDAQLAANPDTGTTAENTILTVAAAAGLLANDSDSTAGAVLTVAAINGVAADVGTQITLASGALLTVNANGSYAYDPNGHFDSLGVGQTAVDSFTYQVSDGKGGYATATDTITITGVDTPPVANPDTAVTAENMTLSVPAGAGSGLGSGLLFNDHDIDNGAVLTVSEVNGAIADVGTQITLASGALLTVNANGSYDYNPNGEFASLGVGQTAADSFTYQVSDGQGGFSTATATITITGVNTSPVANADTATIAENMTLSVAAPAGLLANDTDVNNGDVLTVSAVNGLAADVGTQITLASGALLTVNADGSYAYNQNGAFDSLGAGKTATDSFTYQVSDGHGGFATATDTITITGVDTPPVANPDTAVSTANAILSVPAGAGSGLGSGLLFNDHDIDNGAVLTVSEVNGVAASVGNQITLASGALLTVNANGSYDYNPNGEFASLGVGQTAADSFTYQVSDGQGGFSTATATITITGVNTPPVANADTATIAENMTLSVAAPAGLLANDTDVNNGDVLTVSAVNGVAASVGTQITLASGALLTVNADGSYDYNPNGHFNSLGVGQTATDSFTYQVSDGKGGLATATDTITITGVDTPPVANPDTAVTAENMILSVPAGAGSGLGSGLLFNDHDVNSGDVLTVSEVNGVAASVGNQITLASGALLTVNANGSYVYNPNGEFDSLGVGQTAADSFTYQVSDGHGGFSTSTATITITGVNTPPVANPDTATVAENGSLSVTAPAGLLSNDTDVDAGAVLTVSAINGVVASVGTQITLESGALLTVNADGSYAYNPNGHFDSLGVGQTGTDSFTYQVSDGKGGFATATDTITITGVDTPPVASPDTGTIAENMTLSVPAGAGSGLGSGLLFNDHDIDNGAVLTVSEVNGVAASVGNQITLASGALLTVNANGSYVYNPNGEFDSLGVGKTATDNFTYQVSDGHGGFSTSTATITITGVDTPPVANPDTATTTETVALSVPQATGLLANDTDVNSGDVLTVSAVNGLIADVGTQITLASGALLTVNANGSYDYNPNGHFDSLGVGQTATDSFTYQVSDGHGGFATATDTITITGVDTPPVANPDIGATDQNTTLSVPVGEGSGLGSGLLFNDTDVDKGAVLTVTEVNGVAANVGTQITLASGALLTVNANGSYDYNPNGHFNYLAAGQTATDSFTYQVSDGQGGFATSTDTIKITGLNDAPVANAVSTSGAENSASIPITLTGSVVDVGDTIANFSIVALPPATEGVLYSNAALTIPVSINTAITASGNTATIYFVPAANFVGEVVLNYFATDSDGPLNSTNVQAAITVTDPPVVNNDVVVHAAAITVSSPLVVSNTITQAPAITTATTPPIVNTPSSVNAPTLGVNHNEKINLISYDDAYANMAALMLMADNFHHAVGWQDPKQADDGLDKQVNVNITHTHLEGLVAFENNHENKQLIDADFRHFGAWQVNAHALNLPNGEGPHDKGHITPDWVLVHKFEHGEGKIHHDFADGTSLKPEPPRLTLTLHDIDHQLGTLNFNSLAPSHGISENHPVENKVVLPPLHVSETIGLETHYTGASSVEHINQELMHHNLIPHPEHHIM